MKTTKFLITSLLAAAAMGATTAWANSYANQTISADTTAIYTNNKYDNSNLVSGDTVINENCTWTWGTNSGTGHGLIKQTGTLSGAGAWLFTRTQTTDADYGRFLLLSGDNSAFTGTFQLTSSNGDVTKGPNVALLLGSLNAATNATIDLGQCTGVAFASGVTSANVGGFVGTSASSWILAKSSTPTESVQSTNKNGSWWEADATEQTINLTGSGEYAFAGRVGNAVSQTGTLPNPYTLSINKTGTGKQTFSGLVALKNLSVSAGELVFSGTANIAGTTTVTGGALDVSSGTTTFGGALTLSGGSVAIGTLGDGESAAVAAAGAVTISDSVGVTLAGAAKNGTFAIFSGNTLSNTGTLTLSATNSGFTQNWTTNGNVTYVTISGAANSSLVWAGGTDSWTWNTSDTKWKLFGAEGATPTNAFKAGDDVKFATAGAQIVFGDTAISADAITIAADTTFSGVAGKLSATGGITILDGASLTVKSQVWNSDTTIAGIKLDGADSKLVLQDGIVLYGKAVSGTGTLEVTGSADSTIGSHLFLGDITVKKTGTGTLTLNGTSSTFTGKLLVSGGTVKLGSATGMGAETVSVEVATGGTLDLQGYTDNKNYGNYVLSGGALVNNRAEIGSGRKQLAGGITLTADSEVGGSYNFGMVSGSFAKNTLTLNGHTLTKTGSNTFWLTATTVTAGTIDVREGALSLRNGGAADSGKLFSMDADAWIKLNGGTITVGKDGSNFGTVTLGNVAIVFNDANKDTARITVASGCNFTVASSAVLRLDIGALTEATLTGEQVALTIAAASAFDNSFFSAVEVGTYVDDAWQISSEWKYLADSWDVGAGTLKISAIPEPSTFGLLAGLGALALAGTRRRRRK